MQYLVTEVRKDPLGSSVQVRTFGLWTEKDDAERFRRQLLAHNVDLYYPANRRPTVHVTTIEPAILPTAAVGS